MSSRTGTPVRPRLGRLRGVNVAAFERRVAAALASPPATLFLLAVVVFGATWRVDAFITDTIAIANALANLADGSLHFTTVYYGPADAQTPGVYVSDGRLYGRNYGQVFAALPVLYALRGLSLVVAPGVLFAGMWSLGVTVLGRRAAAQLGDERVAWCGYGLAVLAFLAHLAFGTALPARLYPMVALQVVTVGAAAALVATSYLLVGLFYDRRTAAATAAATLLVGPVAFWATIPKRHVITAFLVLATAYLLARSRTDTDADEELRYRAAAYLPVGLTAWVSAPEGFLLLVALAPVDLATARRRDRRALATVAAALGVGLLPFFLTNLAVAGNPLVPPRLLVSARAAGAALAVEPSVAPSNPIAEGVGIEAGGGPGGAEGASGGGGGGVAVSPGGIVPTLVAVAASIVGSGVGALEQVTGQAERGLDALSPGRLYHVFVRSGRIPGVNYAQTGGETIDLTLLESAPLLGALLVVPLRALGRLRSPANRSLSAEAAARFRTPLGTTDLFALAFVAVFTLFHLPRLPIHSTVTVRYLTPVVPLLVYAVVRLRPVRAVVSDRPGRLGAVAAGAVVVGGAAGIAGFAVATPTVGVLMQTHALVNLGVAALVAGWLLLAPEDTAVGATVLGLAAAAMVLFLVGTGFEYFATDRHYLLAVARLVETAIPIL